MSDERDDRPLPFYAPNRPPDPPRQPNPGELLFEFTVERTHTRYRVELRDHGDCAEAQFFDEHDLRIARTFHQYLNLYRTPREMAIAWAIEERKAIESEREASI